MNSIDRLLMLIAIFSVHFHIDGELAFTKAMIVVMLVIYVIGETENHKTKAKEVE